VALKLALHAQQRKGICQATKILTLANSYHGDTIGAMSAAQQGVFTQAYTPFLFQAEVLKIPYTTDISEPIGPREQDVLAKAETHFASGQFAAFIAEPLVQGAGGIRFYSRALLDGLWALARQNGVYIIADEVMTGFGRTGSLFAADGLATAPDLVCLSKGLTGGMLPLGVTLASKAIWDLFDGAPVADRFLHGHSFTANPITCAVALESWNLLHEQEEIARRQAVYTNLASLATELSSRPKFKNVRALGSILALELNVPGVQGYLNTIGAQAYTYFLEQGLVLRPLGNTLYILPPYCITKEEIQRCGEAFIAFAERL
jgi:adenosylmethionine-8-amino-7-oxononanoate aminotransferase